MGSFPSLPDLGQPNPGQYGPPAPGSLNNPLNAPGFDLGQPNPGEYGPPAPGSQNNPDLWSRLMNAVGNLGLGNMPKMPGTTIGAPAGAQQMAPPAVPPPVFPGQAAAPPGIPYFRTQQQQPASSNLMSQYLALQQLMRGS